MHPMSGAALPHGFPCELRARGWRAHGREGENEGWRRMYATRMHAAAAERCAFAVDAPVADSRARVRRAGVHRRGPSGPMRQAPAVGRQEEAEAQARNQVVVPSTGLYVVQLLAIAARCGSCGRARQHPIAPGLASRGRVCRPEFRLEIAGLTRPEAGGAMRHSRVQLPPSWHTQFMDICI